MSQQRDFWGGGVLNRTVNVVNRGGILPRHEARVYIELMLKMLRGETK